MIWQAPETFRRCGCRNSRGQRLEQNCPKLADRGQGTWYFHCSAPSLVGRSDRIRRGGYPSQAAARQARDETRQTVRRAAPATAGLSNAGYGVGSHRGPGSCRPPGRTTPATSNAFLIPTWAATGTPTWTTRCSAPCSPTSPRPPTARHTTIPVRTAIAHTSQRAGAARRSRSRSRGVGPAAASPAERLPLLLGLGVAVGDVASSRCCGWARASRGSVRPARARLEQPAACGSPGAVRHKRHQCARRCSWPRSRQPTAAQDAFRASSAAEEEGSMVSGSSGRVLGKFATRRVDQRFVGFNVAAVVASAARCRRESGGGAKSSLCRTAATQRISGW